MAVSITFDLAKVTTEDAVSLMVLLAQHTGPITITPIAHTTQATVTATNETASPVAAVEEGRATEIAEATQSPVQTITPEAEAPKAARRGRPKKETPVELAEEASEEPAVRVPAEAPKSYTLDDLRNALKAFTEKHDVQKGIELLGAFKCSRVSDMAAMPFTTQELFVGRCNG